MEAQGFRDRIQDFADANTVTLGITFSSTDDLRAWRDEIGASFELLSDADRTVAMQYGAAESASQEKAARLSVLVAPTGTVLRIYEGFEASEHAAQVLQDLDAMA